MAVTSQLLRLPAELLLRTSSYLNAIEMGNLRLTSKQIETSLFRSFARKFFTKRRFTIEQVSLEALVGIANHKALALYVTEVVISTESLCPKAWEPDSWRQAHLERQVFINTGQALHLLVNAFSRLKNLCIVALHDCKLKNAWRSGQDNMWKDNGWSLPRTISRAVGPLAISLGRHRLHRKSADPIFALILNALGEAGARLKSIKVYPTENFSGTSLDIMSGPLAGRISPVISGLQNLHLSFHGQQDVLPIYRLGVRPLYGLQVYLQHTPLLEHLRLEFNADNSRMPRELLCWLAQYADPTIGYPAPVRLEFLATLELGSLALLPQTLLDVVSKFSTLTSISLREITLENGGATAHIRNVWSDFLLELCDHLKRHGAIRLLFIRNPTYKHPSVFPFTPVYFATNACTDGNKVGKDYTTQALYHECTGSDVHAWLIELASKTSYADLGA